MDSMALNVEKRGFQDRIQGYKPNSYNRGGQNHQGRTTGYKRRYCSHCKISGHNYENCWKVHGYPLGFKQNTWKRNSNVESSGRRANMVQGEEMQSNYQNDDEKLVTTDLTKSQYSKLLSMLKEDDDQMVHHTDSKIGGAAFMVGIGKYRFLSSKLLNWIVDNGVTDHMCHDL